MPYPPLFQPGFQQIQIGDIPSLFVHPFPTSTTRAKLAASLTTWIGKVATVGVPGQIWLDGSFSTTKPDPSDIDLLVVMDANQVNGLGANARSVLTGLLDNASVKVQYDCDVYFTESANANMLSYWRGWFGFSRNLAPKGIPVIQL